MRKYLLITILFTTILVSAQQISFQHHYAKGDNTRITTFTELESGDIILAYSLIHIDTSHSGPHSLELHLMKIDKNGNELWDKLIRQNNTDYVNDDDRFSTQDINEQKDGSLLLDVTYPYGEKYLVKFDSDGNQGWESYLHNSFGDNNLYSSLIKQRCKNIALTDGRALSLGASFTSVSPRATLSIIDEAGSFPYDIYYYNGYFNNGFYLNSKHIFTLGVEQSGTMEILVLSDIRLDGGVNYHAKTAHNFGEKIRATSFFYTSSRIRVAEILSKKDTVFYVNIYDYNHQGTLLGIQTFKLKCAATLLSLDYAETDWVLSNKCKTEEGQIIEKVGSNDHLEFSFSNVFDSVLMLKKIHDGNYLFCFSKGSGINLWKLNAKGTLKTGTAAEGFFAPNPARDRVTFIGNKDTRNHGVKIMLYDMLGNTLREYSFEPLAPITLNLTGLREGLYAYYMITDIGTEFRGKIVIDELNYR